MPHHHVSLHYFHVLHIRLHNVLEVGDHLHRLEACMKLFMGKLDFGPPPSWPEEEERRQRCVFVWLFTTNHADKTKICERIERHQTDTESTFMCWSLIEVHKSLVKLTNSELEVMFEREGKNQKVST